MDLVSMVTPVFHPHIHAKLAAVKKVYSGVKWLNFLLHLHFSSLIIQAVKSSAVEVVSEEGFSVS